MATLIYYAFPAFIVTMVLELLWARRAIAEGRAVRGYEPRDSAASLTMGTVNVLISAVTKYATLAAMAWLWQYRLFDLPNVWWTWVLLFFAEDLCYYAFHRASHDVRFFWAAHVNHHSSRHYNLSTALRQSWTTPLTGPIFWMVLPLIGFEPWMVFTQQAISLLYQYWLHTEAIGNLGPLEKIFNTPSHHRVHHGRNVEYLDRNHGGILIIWDKLFGTFTPEREPVDYGLVENLESFNPITIAFHEWAAIARDVRSARSLREVIGYIFGPPGWRPDTRALTSAGMREAAARQASSSGPSIAT